MRITFVGLGWEQLSICLMGALARNEGHEVSLAFNPSLFDDRFQFAVPALSSYFDETESVLKTIERLRPDVLAFSSLSGTYQWMLGVAESSKRMHPGLKVIFGGVHPTAVSERVLARPFVDYVVVGEGDIAFPLILKAIARGGPAAPIPNTRFRHPDGEIIRGPQIGFIEDLDALPVYDKSLYEDHMRYHESYITMASRGCPYRCTFCFNNFFARLPEEKGGRYVRLRSPEHMIRELVFARHRYGTRLFEFFDDVFTLDKRWMKRFLGMYKKEIGVPYQIFTHVNFIDEDVARMLSDSGCRTAQIGLQSLDDEYKRSACLRYETTERSARALDLLRQYSVKVKVDHMFGLPGEPIESQEVAHRFYNDHPPYRILTYWTNFFPGTDMFKEVVKDGLITPAEAEAIEEGEPFNCFLMANKHIDQLKMKTYKVYEMIFKILPGLPVCLRKSLRVSFLEKWPLWILSTVTFCWHVAIGILRGDPDAFFYITYYFYHMKRFWLIKMGFNVPPASRLRDTTEVGAKLLRKRNMHEEKITV